MRAGRFRHRLKLLRAVVQRDDAGSHRTDLQVIGYFWGSVEGLRGNEGVEAGMSRAEMDYRIRVRLPIDIRVSDRIEMGGRRFDVQTAPVDEMGRGREAWVMAKEYTDG